MSNDSMAMIILCSHLCLGEGMRPLEPREWSAVAEILMSHKLSPCNLLTMELQELENLFSPEESLRIKGLSARSGSISFELNRYETMGIHIVTRADKAYPHILKKKLGNVCPPLFYYAGDLTLCNGKGMGFVGSRTIGEKDDTFTRSMARKAVTLGYTIVSGGAKGVDSISARVALEEGGCAIEYLSDSLERKLRKKEVIQGVREGRRVLLSIAKPDAGFHAGIAMSRNKFIYSQSEATVVVRSEYQKGGTWNGANEALKKEYCTVLCWDSNDYHGNQAIIANGAIAINENSVLDPLPHHEMVEQLNLFE